jgi:FkbM family methyltransferase
MRSVVFLAVFANLSFFRYILLKKLHCPSLASQLISGNFARNCANYELSATPTGPFARVIFDLLTNIPSTTSPVNFVSDFFRHFSITDQAIETRNILKEGLFIALSCNKMWLPISRQLERILHDCPALQAEVPKLYPGLEFIVEEVLCSAHGLRFLDASVMSYVRGRTALDIGGFNGDSAVILMNFSKQVYSFEPGPPNFRQLNETLSKNRHHFGSAKAFPIGLSNSSGTMQFVDSMSSASVIDKNGSVTINVTTLDEFLRYHDIEVGFIKCDTEGHGLAVLQGAKHTLIRHRPVFSLSVYHNGDEFFKIPILLKKWLPNYDFGWTFAVNSPFRWHELLFTGIPREIQSRTD